MMQFQDFYAEVVRLSNGYCCARVEAIYSPGSKSRTELRYCAYDARDGVAWTRDYASPEECLAALCGLQRSAGYPLAQLPPTVPGGAEAVGSLEELASSTRTPRFMDVELTEEEMAF